jgi:hypothetical protein
MSPGVHLRMSLDTGKERAQSRRRSPALQAVFDAWLDDYNRERSHLYCRNQSQTPWQTIQQLLPMPDVLAV